MGMLARIASVFDKKPRGTALVPVGESRSIGGATARLTQDTGFGQYFAQAVPRTGVQTSYANLSEELLSGMDDAQVRDLIRASNPIVSKAVADYEDWVMSGFTWTADKFMDETGLGSPAQQLIETFLKRMDSQDGGMEAFIRSSSRGMFAHGGSFTELVVDKDKKTPRRLKAIDPTTAVFVRDTHPVDGETYRLGQNWTWQQDGRKGRKRKRKPTKYFRGGPVSLYNWVDLEDDITIQYRAIQPEPNYPYGTPLLDPAVFYVIVVAGFFNLFKQSLQGHVWPATLFTVDKEKFTAAYPNLKPEQIDAQLKAFAADILDKLKNLKPGGAMVYGDELSLGSHLTGTQRSPIGSIKDIDDVVRRELIPAVKSQPILMGSNESIAETHANIQLIAYGKLIRKTQKIFNPLITDYFNLILELNGYPPLSDFRLHYQNTAEYRDQSLTYRTFREGLLAASQDLQAFVEALDAAKTSGYLNEQDAQDMFDEGMAIRRELNIIPQDL